MKYPRWRNVRFLMSLNRGEIDLIFRLPHRRIYAAIINITAFMNLSFIEDFQALPIEILCFLKTYSLHENPR